MGLAAWTIEHSCSQGARRLGAAAIGLALLFWLAACSSTSLRPRQATKVIGATSGADTPAVRAAFRAALARIGEAGPVPADPPSLRTYAIYPYLVAARLRAALSRQPLAASAGPLDTRIADFLTTHRREPVTRELAHDWLVSLAARQQWHSFLEHVSGYPAAVADPVLACDTFRARLAIGETGGRSIAGPELQQDGEGSADGELTSAALALWSQPNEQPGTCDAVFDWLLRQGLLTPERVEARARAALTAGHVRLGLQLAAGLPATQAAPLREWARLIQRPREALEALAQSPAMQVDPDALVAGVKRLALSDSAAAAAVLPALLMRPGMTAELAGQLQRSVALGLAYDHAAGAAAALLALPADVRDDTVREWGVRIAIWNGMWPQALTWLNQLSAVTADVPRWRYWRARALEMVAGGMVAEPLFRSLAALRDYYGYLAADHLQLRYDLQAHPTPPEPAVQAALAMRPGMIRAHELFECGLVDAARIEWAVALQGVTRAQRIQAARIAEERGWYAQAIAQLGLADDLDDVALRYPRPYAGLVSRASALADVPPDWVFAVMRQESLFRADAVSRANAQGLMQLIPATASAVAYRWHVTLNGEDALFDPQTAVTLGAARLRELLDRYDGALALALAAYNAGAAPVARWRPPQPMDADIWIENISYGETRDYVERVLENIVAYRWARGAPLRRLSGLLPAIGPEPAGAGAPRDARYPGSSSCCNAGARPPASK